MIDPDVKKIAEQLQHHFDDDIKNFKRIDDANLQQEKDHTDFRDMLEKIERNQIETKSFMENLAGVNDFVKAAGLLKKPLIWVVAVIAGIVILVTNLKTIIGWFLIQKL